MPAETPRRVADEPFVELPLDVASERELRLFRALSALVVGAVAAVVLVLSPDARGWLCALASLLVALGWWGTAARARPRLRSPRDWSLSLRPAGLVLRDGPGRERSCRWSEVTEVTVDEERLDVRVELTTGSPLRIEPRFGGLGAYDLARAVTAAWRAGVEARAPEADEGGAHAPPAEGG